MKCSWWPPCWWLPTASSTPHWAAMFQCKTRGQRGESAAKLRAVLRQSALKRSERWLQLTGNEQGLSMERPPQGGGRRTGHCAEGGGETLSTWPLTTWHTGGQKKAGQLSCGWNATMRRVGAAPESIHLNINQFIQQQMQANLPWWHQDNLHSGITWILSSSSSSLVTCQNVLENSNTLTQTLNCTIFKQHMKLQFQILTGSIVLQCFFTWGATTKTNICKSYLAGRYCVNIQTAALMCSWVYCSPHGPRSASKQSRSGESSSLGCNGFIINSGLWLYINQFHAVHNKASRNTFC